MSNRLRLCLYAGAAGVVFLGLGKVAETVRGFDPFRLDRKVSATGPVVLQQVQKLQRLETCRYNGEVIVEGDRKGMLPVWLRGDRMLFVGRGEVVAGVDLARLRPEDVQVQGEVVGLRLPRPEILHSGLDTRASQVHERQTGIFGGGDPQLETEVRVEAEDRIRAAALESGVLDTAEQNARETLKRQMELLGFREVRFLGRET
jgi:hypothetical protein